jgi:hypothetical protein
MNFLSKFWHKIVGQKSAVIRLLEEVAGRLESSHPETLAHLNNAFHPATNSDLEALRLKVAADLRAASKSVHAEHHAKDDAFESHDQHASLAQSTFNEQLTYMEVAHTGVGDDLDAFFNKYGTGDLGGWIPVFLKIVAEKVHLQQKSEFPHVDPDDPEALITLLPATCKIILISDWGANNDHAANVRDRIAAEIQATSVPVFLVHLGDIYYSGTRSECLTFLRNWPLRDANGPTRAAASRSTAITRCTRVEMGISMSSCPRSDREQATSCCVPRSGIFTVWTPPM